MFVEESRFFTRKSSTKQSPTTTKRFDSNRVSQIVTSSADSLGIPRRDTTKPLPIAPRRFDFGPTKPDYHDVRGYAYGYKEEISIKPSPTMMKLVRLDPTSAGGYRNRGKTYMFMKQHELEKAIADLTEAIRLDPKRSREDGIIAATRGRKSEISTGRSATLGKPFGLIRKSPCIIEIGEPLTV